MFPVHDVDAFLLLAMAHASKRRPAELVEIIAAGDLIQGAACSEQDLAEAFQRLSQNSLIIESEGGYTLTADAQQILTAKRRKTEAHERVSGIKEKLAAYIPQNEPSPTQVTEEQLKEAVLAYQRTRSLTVRSLLTPKPKPSPLSVKRRDARKPFSRRK